MTQYSIYSDDLIAGMVELGTSLSILVNSEESRNCREGINEVSSKATAYYIGRACGIMDLVLALQAGKLEMPTIIIKGKEDPQEP